ncbi:MAG TPA: CHAD domain-containing protein [Methylosinus sp.]|jgi:CHAD domain-containing protein|uniref:CYTH and CHAD domain-containing protein n=1 Tax=Methylosinus sp. TaxID=427 RepID=UPI002F93CAA3
MDRLLASSASAQEATRRAIRGKRSGEGPRVRFGTDRAGMNAAARSESLTIGAVSRPTRRIRSIVFDTAVDDLGKQNILLRGYEMHGAAFVELSWARAATPGGARGSIELRVPSLEVGKMLGFSEPLRRSIANRPLEARSVAETERRERVLERAHTRIAVCFDDGFVECGGRRSDFHEIELQLLEGAEEEFWTVAAELAPRAKARFLPMSEVELALARATGAGVAPVKARRPTLAADASLDEAIVTALSACLDQFVANWPALQSHAPEEAIHQMRVALRRLRAGVGMLRRGVVSEALEAAAVGARDISATLGAARNLDVLVDLLVAGPLAQANGEPRFYALLDAAERRRIEAHAAVAALVAAPATTQFVIDLRAALAAKAWRPPSGDATQQRSAFDPSAPGTAKSFAMRSLDRLHRRALKKSRDLAALTPDQRHQARIAFKKARYAAEFFESLFGAHAKARRYLRRTAALQDKLGAVNDLTVAAELLRGLGEADADLAPASAFAIGWCAHARAGAAVDWKKTERSLKTLETFWR